MIILTCVFFKLVISHKCRQLLHWFSVEVKIVIVLFYCRHIHLFISAFPLLINKSVQVHFLLKFLQIDVEHSPTYLTKNYRGESGGPPPYNNTSLGALYLLFLGKKDLTCNDYNSVLFILGMYLSKGLDRKIMILEKKIRFWS